MGKTKLISYQILFVANFTHGNLSSDIEVRLYLWYQSFFDGGRLLDSDWVSGVWENGAIMATDPPLLGFPNFHWFHFHASIEPPWLCSPPKITYVTVMTCRRAHLRDGWLKGGLVGLGWPIFTLSHIHSRLDSGLEINKYMYMIFIHEIFRTLYFPFMYPLFRLGSLVITKLIW